MDEPTENAPKARSRRAGVRRDVRAAAIGGLAAAFVVAASLAPKLLSHPGEVNVHNSSTESALVESTTTTAPETTTTEAPTTTTTVAPTTTTTLSLETRLARLEATTTTTTAPPPVAPTVGAIQIVPDGVSLYFYNHQDAPTRAAFPNPAVRLTVITPDGTQEIVAPLPVQEYGRYTIPAPGATAVTVVDTEWDGGYLPTGAGQNYIRR